jgi:hypothetical protein
MAVLSLAEAPDQHENRLGIAQRAEPFDVWGWPTSLDRRARPARKEKDREGGVAPRLWPVLGAAACVFLVIGAIFLLTSGGGSKTAGNKAPEAAPSDSASDFPSPSDSVEPSPTKTKHSPSPTPTTHSPTPAPTTHRPAPPPPTPKPTPKPPKPGTLSVTGCTIDSGDHTCGITLTAVGGPVNWHVTSADGVSASGGDTSLKKGQSTMVTATKPSPCTGTGGTVSFSPKGTATVQYGCLLGN